MSRRIWPMLFTLILALAMTVRAGLVVLNDGTRLEGQVKKTPDGWTVTAADGTVTQVPAGKVARVELSGSSDASTEAKLASLKRAVEPLNDLDQIIQRFERFIAANPNSPATEDARGELALWKDRKARQMIKVGPRWMTPADRDSLLAQIDPKIVSARQLLAGGQIRDVEPVISEILELDPKNISALYLQGLILFQQEKLPAARKAFEGVNAQISDHAPTLNNLAVINFRQNQAGPALNFFDQAMLAAPADRVILDNVAEALYALQDDRQRAAVAKRVARRFEEQDAVLAARMQSQNLFRWGATWVSKDQIQQLQKAEAEIKQRLDQLKVDFDTLTAEIGELERQIEVTDQNLRRMEADTYVRTNDGSFIRVPLPRVYYDEQRNMQVLRSRRAQAISQQQVLREQAKRIEQDLPVPRYTGVQKLIGEEGTPIDDLPPATQPAGGPTSKPVSL